MRKVERTVIPAIILSALLLLLGSVLYSQSSSLLLEHKIRNASVSELQAMVSLRNLKEGSEQQMREALYAYHALTIESKEADSPSEEETYKLTIHSADSVRSDSSSSLVLLEGNVTVSFSLEGEQTPKRLSADAILVDLERTFLSAQGSVLYEDGSENAALDMIEGSIVSFDWSNQHLIISDATTSTQKSNSEDVSIDLYTHGSRITYKGNDGGIFYQDGFIATAETDPLSSISAKQLSFLSGGDVMVKHATLKLGRVPVLWTPFFFFPSNRMVGNPSIGFVSDRGMFVSTTWELWGTYPNFEQAEQNSFTRLLSNAESGDVYPSGVLYGAHRKSTPFSHWAEQSNSYLTLFADAYELSGLYAGYESRSSFLSRKVIFESSTAFALDPLGTDRLDSYADVQKIRYWGKQALSVDTSDVDVTLQIPYYSDPSVLRTYGNRLSTFAFDSLLGKFQDFPTTFRSDIPSFTWSLSSSIRIPTKKVSPYVSNFSISKLDAQAYWAWRLDNGIYSYQLQKVTLPQFQAALGGTIFNLTHRSKQEPTAIQSSEAKTSDQEKDLLLPSIMDLPVKTTAQGTKDVARNLSLSYSFNQQVEHTLSVDEGVVDWQNDRYLYALTKGSIELKAVPDSRLLSISQEILPQFSFIEDQSKLTYQKQQMQLFSSTKAQIPYLGLSYHLSQRLYRSESQLSYNAPSLRLVEPYQFDKSSVTIHQIKFEKSLSFGAGTLRPSISANLYPIAQSLLPQLRYNQGPYSAMIQYRFSEINDVLKADLFTANFGYTTKAFTFSAQQNYDPKRTVAHFTEAVTLSAQAKQTFFGSTMVLTQNVTYQGLSLAGTRHYIDRLSLEAKFPYFLFRYTFKGPYDQLESNNLKITFSARELEKRWWKNRIALLLSLDSTFEFSFEDKYASHFDIQATVGLRIAEFADIFVSVASSNTGFFRYYDTQDHFSFSLLWEDLLRSFDFTGNGRYNTQFNLSSLSVEMVHYLTDWSLNCKYTGSVVLSNNQYNWVPSFSVFLKWNTIPELDVEETWKQSDGIWMRSSGT